MKIIHIVRRYGPFGGMERYVWETTRELVKLGHEVQVICEVCLADKPVGIAVHELGRMFYRPRWIYYLRFSHRVTKWLREHPQPGWLIHSHERVGMHDVTTFHGPPFASVRDKPWWKKISLRIAMQLYLERRELSVAKYIVPNSPFIKQQLAHYYPEYAYKLTVPIVPGVTVSVLREPRPVPAKGGVIGFVGKEWKRKGLPMAVEIVAALRRTRPDLKFIVVGPEVAEIEHLFADWQGGYQLLGWSNQAHYADFDVLLHPASAEPYGMVISEAMASCVPVVISDVCGAAAQVSSDAGSVLTLSSPIVAWLAAIEKQFNRTDAAPRFQRGWDRVAQEYEVIYQNCRDRT